MMAESPPVSSMARWTVDLTPCTVTITGCKTVRDADGLAMSSRNARLSAQARAIAPSLHRAMQVAATAIRLGTPPDHALDAARQTILSAGFDRIDYLALCDPATLAPTDTPPPACWPPPGWTICA